MESKSTVLEHLGELRKRIIISAAAVIIATIASVPFAQPIFAFLKAPASGVIDRLAFFSPEEAFLVYMRVSFSAGFLFSFPVIVHQIWAFAVPAIGDDFKRYAFYFIIFVSASFLAGCLFSYYILLPNALKFLLSIGAEDLVPVISAARYISFVTGMVLACGLVFQMPVLSFFLTRVGIINARILRKNFKYALVVITIVAAVITPTVDIFNMTAMALPMVLLYEVSVWVAWAAEFIGKKRIVYGRA
ncbi:MAG: twin-arginine translocase subunit TatC [Candidatus Omnitrophota bacterium]|nr:twin-arginine translocase subunit TatC [Candidatus Omnitrophota bacterium]